MRKVCGSVAILVTWFLWTTAAADEVVVYGQVGGTLTLPKESDAEGVYVYWYFGTETDPMLTYTHISGIGRINNDSWKDRASLEEPRSRTDFSLIIRNIKKEEFTSFRCEVKIQDNVISATRYLLRSVSVPAVQPLLAGERLSLHCDVQSQKPLNIRVEWKNPKKEVHRSTSDRSLTVEKVTLEDHGEWHCVVHYGDKEASAGTAVTVMDLYPPKSKTIYASSSHPLHIPCSIPPYATWEHLLDRGFQEGHWSFTPSRATGVSGEPQRLLGFSLSPNDPPVRVVPQNQVPTNSSTLGEPELSALQRNNRNLTLSFKRATEAHRGEYTCALKSQNGVTLKRTMKLEVLQVLSSGGPELKAGQQVNLTCSLGHPLTSDQKVKWFPPRSSTFQVSLSPDPHPDHLVIPGVSHLDGGRWRCELSGMSETAEITLKIGHAPMDVWLVVTICAASVIFILLLILTVILFRRRRQRAMMPRRRKHRFCRCKDRQPKGFYRS